MCERFVFIAVKTHENLWISYCNKLEQINQVAAPAKNALKFRSTVNEPIVDFLFSIIFSSTIFHENFRFWVDNKNCFSNGFPRREQCANVCLYLRRRWTQLEGKKSIVHFGRVFEPKHGTHNGTQSELSEAMQNQRIEIESVWRRFYSSRVKRNIMRTEELVETQWKRCKKIIIKVQTILL